MKKIKKSKQYNKVVKFSSLTDKGWNTTDLDEIARRKLRGQTEALLMQSLDSEFSYFGDFLVHSKQRGTKYLVEIRSLTSHINSCECLDYRANSLGTCKHIEHVLFKLATKKGGKRKFKQAALVGSPKIEIYIDRCANNVMQILWPKKLDQQVTIYQKLAEFFDVNGNLTIDLLTAYEQIPLIVSNDITSQVRISKHMDDVVARQRTILEKQTWKQQVLTKLDHGTLDLKILKVPLYPYQEQGMLHLALNERALLADDMGLGKTVQAIAACEWLYRTNKIKKVLIVTPASLKGEWLEQIEKFTARSNIIIQGARGNRLKQYQSQAVFYLAHYEQIVVDGAWLQHLLAPDVIILDEAQRIKNWQTKTANAIKKLKSRYAFVLTGTPLENRIDDLYSIVQFLDPYLFGSLFRFNRDFYQLDDAGKAVGYKNLDQLHARLQPIMLRRLKQEIETQLPDRTIKNYLVAMEPEQKIRYEEYEKRVSRLLAQAKRRNLRKEEHEQLQRYLACMRMICDSPYILDPACKISPKLQELTNILEDLLIDPQAKIIIFSEWARMLELVRELAIIKEIEFAWHTGSVNPAKRQQEINKFKTLANCRLFLSTDAGSVGLNLQAANIVINLDLPWNPAKLEQRIARAWRKNQNRMVRVINFVCENSIEERMPSLLSQKQNLARGALDGDPEVKTMQLPSGRKALVERLTDLIGSQVDDQFPSSIVALSAVQPSVVKELNPTELLVQEALQIAKTTNKQVMAVVNHNLNQATELLQQEMTKEPTNNVVEIIDESMFKLLKHLEQQGILTLNANVQLLVNTKDLTLTEQQPCNVVEII